MFKPLTKNNIHAIIDLLIADVNKRLVEKELRVELTDAAKDFVVEGGYDPMYGRKTAEEISAEKCGDSCRKADPCRKCGTGRHDPHRRGGRKASGDDQRSDHRYRVKKGLPVWHRSSFI